MCDISIIGLCIIEHPHNILGLESGTNVPPIEDPGDLPLNYWNFDMSALIKYQSPFVLY